jgi:hypothetical protein
LSCIPHPLCPGDAERDTYLVLDAFGCRLGSAWRETDAERADLAPLICWTANDDAMSDNRLNKALIMGYDTGPGGDHCAHGFRPAVSTLFNEEGAFDGDVVKPNSPTTRRKKAPAARRVGAAPAW